MRFRIALTEAISLCQMGNVLNREKREQVLTLGHLGWPLRRIEEATGVRRANHHAPLGTSQHADHVQQTRRRLGQLLGEARDRSQPVKPLAL
jgi:hypothetical protein